MRSNQESLLSRLMANPSPLFRRLFIERQTNEFPPKFGDACEIGRAMGWTTLMCVVDQFCQDDGAEKQRVTLDGSACRSRWVIAASLPREKATQALVSSR